MFVLATQIVLFAHLTWLGLYLLGRSRGRRDARSVGAAICALAYAMAISQFDIAADRASLVVMPLILSVGLLTSAIVEVLGGVGDRSGRVGLPDFVVVAGLLLAAASVPMIRRFDLAVAWPVLATFGVAYLGVGAITARRLAREQGEAFLPDILRSYDYSFLVSALFGGQVALAMWSGPGATDSMVLLLLGTITAAIAIQVFLQRVQGLLDRIAFANLPWLVRERAELREVENLLPRVNMTDPLAIDETEFTKLTRRALSHFGDLPKLATSPLTNLPEVHRRLAAKGAEPATLERARELKAILAEAIDQLKPGNGMSYGTTDEWRYFNAIYYPYVVGMRPYSVTAVHDFDDPHHDEVLEWFRVYVPERTLYNWQNAAAALIANHLREQEEIALAIDPATRRELTASR